MPGGRTVWLLYFSINSSSRDCTANESLLRAQAGSSQGGSWNVLLSSTFNVDSTAVMFVPLPLKFPPPVSASHSSVTPSAVCCVSEMSAMAAFTGIDRTGTRRPNRSVCHVTIRFIMEVTARGLIGILICSGKDEQLNNTIL